MMDILRAYLKQKGIELKSEYKFKKNRKWLIDMYFEYDKQDRYLGLNSYTTLKIGIEQEGGVWTQGRHTRGQGFIDDMEKYNAATLAGIQIYRFTPQMIEQNEEILLVKRLLEGE